MKVDLRERKLEGMDSESYYGREVTIKECGIYYESLCPVNT